MRRWEKTGMVDEGFSKVSIGEGRPLNKKIFRTKFIESGIYNVVLGAFDDSPPL